MPGIRRHLALRTSKAMAEPDLLAFAVSGRPLRGLEMQIARLIARGIGVGLYYG